MILHASGQDASLCSLLSSCAGSSCLLSFISLLQDSAYEQQESRSAAGSIICKVRNIFTMQDEFKSYHRQGNQGNKGQGCLLGLAIINISVYDTPTVQVGSALQRGVSGGQQKRVTVGEPETTDGRVDIGFQSLQNSKKCMAESTLYVACTMVAYTAGQCQSRNLNV